MVSTLSDRLTAISLLEYPFASIARTSFSRGLKRTISSRNCAPLAEVLGHAPGDTAGHRHPAIEHVEQRLPQIRRLRLLEQVTVGACLQRWEHHLLIVRSRQYENLRLR